MLLENAGPGPERQFPIDAMLADACDDTLDIAEAAAAVSADRRRGQRDDQRAGEAVIVLTPGWAS